MRLLRPRLIERRTPGGRARGLLFRRARDGVYDVYLASDPANCIGHVTRAHGLWFASWRSQRSTAHDTRAEAADRLRRSYQIRRLRRLRR